MDHPTPFQVTRGFYLERNFGEREKQEITRHLADDGTGGKKPKCRMGFTSYKMPHHHPNETDRLYTHTHTHRVSAVLIKDSRHALELPPDTSSYHPFLWLIIFSCGCQGCVCVCNNNDRIIRIHPNLVFFSFSPFFCFRRQTGAWRDEIFVRKTTKTTKIYASRVDEIPDFSVIYKLLFELRWWSCGWRKKGGGNDKGPWLPRIRPRCAAMTSNKIRSNQQRPWDDEWFQFGPNRATIEFRSCSFHHHASYSPTLLLPLQPNLIFESRNRKRRCLQRVFECCERVCRTAIFERRKKGPFPAREPSNEKLMTSFSF